MRLSPFKDAIIHRLAHTHKHTPTQNDKINSLRFVPNFPGHGKVKALQNEIPKRICCDLNLPNVSASQLFLWFFLHLLANIFAFVFSVCLCLCQFVCEFASVFPMHNLKRCLHFGTVFAFKENPPDWPHVPQLQPGQLVPVYIYIIDSSNCGDRGSGKRRTESAEQVEAAVTGARPGSLQIRV